MIARNALEQAAKRLEAVGIDGAARDARWLLAHVLGTEPGLLAARLEDALSTDEIVGFDALISRRQKRQPVSQIIGCRSFYGLDFKVTPDVLDPRPETEAMIDWALARPDPCRILDLGTGSGVLLVTLLTHFKRATSVGTDESKSALDIARTNAAAHDVADRTTWTQGDWWQPVKGQFDLIVCNPPYIPASERAELAPEVTEWEPQRALFAGMDGLDAYRVLAPELAQHMTPGGRAIFEFGLGQGDYVMAIFRQVFPGRLALVADISGRPRFLSAELAQIGTY